MRVVCAAGLAGTLGACAAVSGLDTFTKGNCASPCDTSPGEGGAGADADGDAQLDASPADGTIVEASPDGDASDDGPQADAHDGAAPVGDGGCAGGCPVSVVSGYGCAVGGCNSADAGCTGAGQSCGCVDDRQCLSGHCVPVPGLNDIACGGRCTGSGASDGFDCLIAAPGIPPLSPSVFGYAPSNFSPGSFSPPATSTTIDCDTTYDTALHAFTAWCAGRTMPNVTTGVGQSGGPAVDVLSFRGLNITAGHTLRLIATGGGGNAVVLAVYGSAHIQGAIHADGSDGVSGTSGAGASGPGGSFTCGNATGASQPQDGRCSGGGGGGASAQGGTGPGAIQGNTAAGGSARANMGASPLFGGCPGGTSGSWACRTSGGGGGGAVQISVAGELLVDGTITANGGAGGTSTCFASGCGANGYGGGAGGGGAGGAILLEGQSVARAAGVVTANGGTGGNPNTGGGGGTSPGGMGGVGGTIASPAGAPGTGSSNQICGPYTACAGGGGGAYGYLRVNVVDGASCNTVLSPLPIASSDLSACLCAADSNCSSGKCVNADSRCSGTCTGAGTADESECQVPTSAPSAWSCPVGACATATTPNQACAASGVACQCTSDPQCATGRCVDWAGCSPGACSGTGSSDAFHCAL